MKKNFILTTLIIAMILIGCSDNRVKEENPVSPVEPKSFFRMLDDEGTNGPLITFDPAGGNLGSVQIGQYKVQKVTVKNSGNTYFEGSIQLNPSSSIWKLYDNQSNATNNSSANTSYSFRLEDYFHDTGYTKDFWIRFTPIAAGTQTNYLSVSGNLYINSGTYSYNVTQPPPLAITISGPEPRNIDGPSVYSAVVSGGKAPYSYRWYIASHTSTYQYVIVPEWTSSSVTVGGGCVNDPAHPGAFVYIMCTVTDSNNPQQQSSDTANASYQVCPTPIKGSLE